MDLYRFFDHDGDLLYVGISLSAAVRASAHRGDQPWWPEVAWMDVQHLPGMARHQAEALERRAIRQEGPRYNIVHAGPPRQMWDYTPPARAWLATPIAMSDVDGLSPMAEWAYHRLRCHIIGRLPDGLPSSLPARHLHAALGRRVSARRAAVLVEELVDARLVRADEDTIEILGFAEEQAAAGPWLDRVERRRLAQDRHAATGGPP